MPCYQRRTTTVDLEVANLDLLTAALENAGYSVRRDDRTIQAHQGAIHLSFREDVRKGVRLHIVTDYLSDGVAITNDIKRAYATEAVRHASKRFGWKLTEQPGGKMQARRKGWR